MKISTALPAILIVVMLHHGQSTKIMYKTRCRGEACKVCEGIEVKFDIAKCTELGSVLPEPCWDECPSLDTISSSQRKEIRRLLKSSAVDANNDGVIITDELDAFFMDIVDPVLKRKADHLRQFLRSTFQALYFKQASVKK